MGDIIDRVYLSSAFDKRRIEKLVNDGSGPDLTAIDDAISASEGEVRDLLSKQYSLAQLQASNSVKRMCAIFTMYSLELRRSDVSAGIKVAYANARATLTALIDGTSVLNAVQQVLPRITQVNAAQLFEQSGYFEGLDYAGSPQDKPGPTVTTN